MYTWRIRNLQRTGTSNSILLAELLYNFGYTFSANFGFLGISFPLKLHFVSEMFQMIRRLCVPNYICKEQEPEIIGISFPNLEILGIEQNSLKIKERQLNFLYSLKIKFPQLSSRSNWKRIVSMFRFHGFSKELDFFRS
jgi:hypothetical protein